MRILQVNSTCGEGSTGKIVRGIAERAATRGYETTVAFARGENRGWDDVIRIGDKNDIRRHGLSTRLLDDHALRSTGATKRFVAELEGRDIDLVHLHNVHGYYLNIQVLFSYLKCAGIPVLWTLHDVWSFTGHCMGFDYEGCERWKTECHDCPLKMTYPISYGRDRSRTNFHQKRAIFTGVPDLTIVTPSQWLGGLVSESYLQGYPRVHIPNEIDRTVFRPVAGDLRARLGLESKYVMLAVANVWEYRKGLDRLVELAPMLRDDEEVVVIGLTPDQIKSLPPRFHGLERTSDAHELAQYYSMSDVFLNPTLEDISSLTNLEAMACGTPVVTFRTGGAPETLAGGYGVVVADRHGAGLRAAIDEVRASGRDNAEYAASPIPEPYSAYVDLYDRVLR